MISNTFKQAFSDAWGMLIDFPLSFMHHNKEEADAPTESTIILTQAFFPVIGLVCALLALLFATILSRFLYPIPAAAVFAGVLTYFSVYKDSGRGLGGVMYLTSKNKEMPFEQGLAELPDSITDLNTSMATLTMILVVLFKLFAFSLMAFYGYTYWLVAIFILEFTIEGDLATLTSLQQTKPLLPIKKSKQRYIWFIAGFLVLFVLFEAPVASLILFGAAFGMSYGIKAYCTDRLNGIDGKIIGLAAYIFELFALLLGLILLTKGQVIPL